LIAAVFWGYDLFRHLFGIPTPDMTEVDRLLSNSNYFGERASSTASLASGTYPTVGAGMDLQEKRLTCSVYNWTATLVRSFESNSATRCCLS
jgi:hypothetical protein